MDPVKAIHTSDEVVRDEGGYFVQFTDGRKFKDETIILPRGQVERIRAGYMCVWCFEPLNVPFPKACPLCTFPCAERQMQVFGKLYAGIDIPPTPLEERLEELDEQDHFKKYGPKTSLIVPRNFRE